MNELSKYYLDGAISARMPKDVSGKRRRAADLTVADQWRELAYAIEPDSPHAG